ncbi:hypothetical protein EMIT0P218_70243 [Pseudomonas sp. IT-P218]
MPAKTEYQPTQLLPDTPPSLRCGDPTSQLLQDLHKICANSYNKKPENNHVVKRVRPVQDWHRPLQLPHRRPDARSCAFRRRSAP